MKDTTFVNSVREGVNYIKAHESVSDLRRFPNKFHESLKYEARDHFARDNKILKNIIISYSIHFMEIYLTMFN